MATLSVWKFDDPQGADRAEAALVELQKQELITVHDTATVTWPADNTKPKTRQSHSTTGAGALGGTFWGLLFGLIFFIPLIGAAIGAGLGALAGSMVDVGIDDDFIDSVRKHVTPGTSALFVLSSDAVIDRVEQSLASQNLRGTLVQTNLSAEQEAKLRAAFEEE